MSISRVKIYVHGKTIDYYNQYSVDAQQKKKKK